MDILNKYYEAIALHAATASNAIEYMYIYIYKSGFLGEYSLGMLNSSYCYINVTTRGRITGVEEFLVQ